MSLGGRTGAIKMRFGERFIASVNDLSFAEHAEAQKRVPESYAAAHGF
jgi:hypothetical protein